MLLIVSREISNFFAKGITLALKIKVHQRISRGDNCVICVEICEISRET